MTAAVKGCGARRCPEHVTCCEMHLHPSMGDLASRGRGQDGLSPHVQSWRGPALGGDRGPETLLPRQPGHSQGRAGRVAEGPAVSAGWGDHCQGSGHEQQAVTVKSRPNASTCGPSSPGQSESHQLRRHTGEPARVPGRRTLPGTWASWTLCLSQKGQAGRVAMEGGDDRCPSLVLHSSDSTRATTSRCSCPRTQRWLFSVGGCTARTGGSSTCREGKQPWLAVLAHGTCPSLRPTNAVRGSVHSRSSEAHTAHSRRHQRRPSRGPGAACRRSPFSKL